MQDVLQTFTEVGISSRCDSRFYPLRTDTNLAHIGTNDSFRDDFTSFLQFLRNLRCAIVLVRFVINPLNLLFDFFSSDFRIRWQAMKPRVIARARHTKNLQHSGDENPAPCIFCSFRLLGDLQIDGLCHFPRMPIAFF